MKKTIIAVAILLGLGVGAKAQPVTNATNVKEVVSYKLTCSSVTIGAAAVDVTSNTAVSSTTFGASAVTVMNLDTAATVYCGDDSGVTSSGNHIGWPVATSPAAGPRFYQTWAISTMQPWYCISTAANTSILVCRQK